MTQDQFQQIMNRMDAIGARLDTVDGRLARVEKRMITRWNVLPTLAAAQAVAVVAMAAVAFFLNAAGAFS